MAIPFSLVRSLAQAQGLSAMACIGVPAQLDPAGLQAALRDGLGDMTWLERTAELRLSPATFAPWATRIVICTLDYQPVANDDGQLRRARYAAGQDYHSLMRKALARVGRAVDAATGTTHQHRACVDSAPVNERTLALAGGVGWIGRNALLIDPRAGSYRFLGTLFTSADLELHHAGRDADRCGACTRCETACPTQALHHRRVISERCISYLTIEHHGVIPRELAARFDGWWYGCDRCQEVCPWNRFASTDIDPRLTGSDHDADLLAVTADSFDQHFAGRAIRRIGYHRFRRNLLVAAYSRNDTALMHRISDDHPLLNAQRRELGLS